MLYNEIKWTDKMRAAFSDEARFLHFVGSTGTSKTLLAAAGIFFDRVMEAPKNVNQFAIVGVSGVLVQRNFVDKADSVYKIHRGLCHGFNKGDSEASGTHFLIEGFTGTKIVYLAGADNKNSYTNILSLDLGGILLDELSVLNIDVIREAYGRVQRLAYPGWIITTTNGGNPTQEFYTEYLNHAKVMFRETVPKIELDAMIEDKPDEHYYHFNLLDDSPHRTPEQTERLMQTHPVGSFYYYSKILGCRGFQEGAIYAPYLTEDHIIPYEDIDFSSIREMICSVDMGTATGEKDTKHAHTIATLKAYSYNGKGQLQGLITLETWVIPSVDIDTIVDRVDMHLLPYWTNHYRKLTKIVIDYGDSGSMLINSWRKRTRYKNITVKMAVKSGKMHGVQKAINLQSRAQMKIQLISKGLLLWSLRAKAGFDAHAQLLSTPDGEEMENNSIINDYGDSETYTITEKWAQIEKLLGA